jgi:hypothetical protein
MHVDTLFSVGIMSHNVPEEIANKVEKTFLEKEHQLPNTGSQYGDFALPERVLDLQNDTPELFAEILKVKDAYSDCTGLEVSPGLMEFWTQDYKDEGNKHGRHCHGIHGISGVYWVRANENAQELIFHNPNNLVDYSKHYKDTPWSWNSFGYKPKKGLMLFFPSYLEHEVQESPPNTVRTTIAFNFPYVPGFNPETK